MSRFLTRIAYDLIELDQLRLVYRFQCDVNISLTT